MAGIAPIANIAFLSNNWERIQPAEFGIYEKNGVAQNVYFWHLIGSKANSYKQKGHSYYLNALRDIQNHGLNQRKEQFFIRLSASKKLEELEKQPEFEKLMERYFPWALSRNPLRLWATLVENSRDSGTHAFRNIANHDGTRANCCPSTHFLPGMTRLEPK